MRFMQTRTATANFSFSTHISIPPTSPAYCSSNQLSGQSRTSPFDRVRAKFIWHLAPGFEVAHCQRSLASLPACQLIMATTPSANLHPRGPSTSSTSINPLPPLLHTPAGLALLELQGTINLPNPDEAINIGRFEFPDYKPDAITFDPASTTWMRRVYLFVGQHQRLTGEVKKLPKAVAVVKRRDGEEGTDELEVVEIVKYKIVFSSRPEPVGTG